MPATQLAFKKHFGSLSHCWSEPLLPRPPPPGVLRASSESPEGCKCSDLSKVQPPSFRLDKPHPGYQHLLAPYQSDRMVQGKGVQGSLPMATLLCRKTPSVLIRTVRPWSPRGRARPASCSPRYVYIRLLGNPSLF